MNLCRRRCGVSKDGLRDFCRWDLSSKGDVMLKDLVLKNRSYRRFHENERIDPALLRQLVDLARLSPSAANLQPLKYVLSHTPEQNAAIFENLAWAGYLTDWDGPEEGERPAAYITILCDTQISKKSVCDHGIAAQSILLGAVERGLGGCMLGSLRRPQLMEVLGLTDSHYEILVVVALGKPKEEVVVERVDESGDIKYWRDENGTHHVPKRGLDEIIIEQD